jgi:hypothetical protein
MRKIKMSKIVTPVVNGAFLALSEARIAPGGDEDSAKFQITVVLDTEDKFWKKLQKAIEQTAKDKWGKLDKKLVLPIKEGDDTDYPEFAGCKTVTVASKRRPEVVESGTLDPIMDYSKMGSGDLFRVSLVPYAWEFPPLNRKGVSLSLSNVMWCGEGDERWDGGSKAADDFADYADDDDDDDLLD